MTPRALRMSVLWLAMSATAHAADPSAACRSASVAVQVLGSGGPELTPGRASSSYLVWHDGRPRVLVDAGGGSALRFGSSGASVASLDAVLLTHLHVDHVADVPALVKASFFGERTRDLHVYGPAEGSGVSGTTAMFTSLFDGSDGVYRYLGGYLTGEAAYRLQVHEITKPPRKRAVHDEGGLAVRAAAVQHGPFPSLAWRIDVGGVSIAFSGDTSAASDALPTLARGADVLVAHHAIPEGPGQPTHLHMTPTRIGEVATEAKVGTLVLSHWMQRTLSTRDQGLAAVRTTWSGPVVEAEDLMCLPVTTQASSPATK